METSSQKKGIQNPDNPVKPENSLKAQSNPINHINTWSKKDKLGKTTRKGSKT